MTVLDSIESGIERIAEDIRDFLALFAPAPLEEEIRTAIQSQITDALGLDPTATDALFAQAKLETGDFSSHPFQVTHSLFNRHVGSGKGNWTGQVFYASAQDPDLRIFSSVEQSARDFAELLSDPLYAAALTDLQAGDVSAYFKDMAKAGFSESKGYAQDMQKVYDTLA